MASLDGLPQIIRQLLPGNASGDLLIAFSGGLDSTVLLHALAEVARSSRQSLRAAHVNHQLHPDATQWSEHCSRVAQDLGVAFQSCTVSVPANPEEGIESAARRARYEALRALLQPGEALLTAHHAEDQLETVLLALVRGSGVDGLAAMPRCRRFGTGWHLRPLLEFDRGQLREWAQARHCVWLDDPSNDNTRFDRNYLRHEVIPGLAARWPAVAQSVVRTALHLGDARTLLDELAARDFASAAVSRCLKVTALEALDPARRRNLLRYWVQSCGARSPSTRKLAALEHDMLAADADRSPCIAWDTFEVRRHRGLMYCGPQLAAVSVLDTPWDWHEPMALGAAGSLRAEIAHGGGLARAKLPPRLHVRNRHGGETLQLAGHAHHRLLKKLLQERNVLPWWRDRLPLLYAGEALIAVADLWIAAPYAADPQEAGVRIVWDGRPQLEGVVESEP